MTANNKSSSSFFVRTNSDVDIENRLEQYNLSQLEYQKKTHIIRQATIQQRKCTKLNRRLTMNYGNNNNSATACLHKMHKSWKENTPYTTNTTEWGGQTKEFNATEPHVNGKVERINKIPWLVEGGEKWGSDIQTPQIHRTVDHGRNGNKCV